VLSEIRPAVVVFVVFSVLTGLAYPLAVTGVSQVVFPYQANGSLIETDGKLVGSELIAQGFDQPQYFWSRPSAAGYNGGASTGSNLGPTNPALLDAVKGRVKALKAADPDNERPVPVDLVTASGSGLDPHISPAAAEYQVPRVARSRDMAESDLRVLVVQHTDVRTLDVLGEPRVNVLQLNMALDAIGTH
jgi:potassium-transporting ATPase KdpC subunit